MTELLLNGIQWSLLLKSIAVLALIYLVIRSLPTLFRLFGIKGGRASVLNNTVEVIRTIFEILAVVIIVVLFVEVNPITNSLVVGVLVILAWSPIRNLLNGRFLHWSGELEVGQQLYFEKQESIIQSVGLFGLTLQTDRGTRIADYTQLRDQGFTLISGAHLSNFLELTVTPLRERTSDIPLNQLMLNCPYLDWSHRPEVVPLEDTDSVLRLKVFLIDETYIPGLIQLINEWGFSVARR